MVGQLHEVLDDDFAANAAILQTVQEGLFEPEIRIRFQVDRVMDTLEEMRDWLDDFVQRRELPSHAALLQRLERRISRLRKPTRLAARGPMILAVLRKLEPVPDRT